MDINKDIKNAVRTVGGIVKGGEKFVNKVYRQMGDNLNAIAGIPKKPTKKQVN